MKHLLNSNTRLSNIDDKMICPNAIDLRLAKVFKMNSNEIFLIDEDQKIHRSSEEILPNLDGYWNLPIGSYEIVMDHIITVGEQEAGWVITRSTLNRNGVFITTGLYDSGYSGPMAACLHVNGGPMRIKKGTRVAQYLTFDAEMLHKYNGSYGLHSEHDKKYL